jgi:phosphatidate cytidylyltransferase
VKRLLKTRFVTAALGLPIMAAAVYWGGAPLFVLLWAISLVAQSEFWAMLGEKAIRGERLAAAGLSAAVVAAGVAGREDLFPPVVAAFVIVALGVQVWRRPAYTVLDAFVTMAGALYLGYLVAYLGLLRSVGVWPLAATIAATWATDTSAYFAGRWFGRRKLCPDLSPGKTVAGAAGGLLGGLAIGGLMAFYLIGAGPAGAVGFGLFVSLGGQMGDLVESSVKRFAGVKDAGRILPGHGGVLDRFDSLLLSAPVAYYFLRLLAAVGR